jgi:hypothetical protein
VNWGAAPLAAVVLSLSDILAVGVGYERRWKYVLLYGALLTVDVERMLCCGGWKKKKMQ